MSALTAGEYVAALEQAKLLANLLLLNRDQLVAAQQHIQHVHALAPILDPTSYRRGMGNLDDAADVLGPLCKAAAELAPVFERLRAKAGAA